MPIDLNTALGAELPSQEFSWTASDIALYSLGVGAAADPMDTAGLGYIDECTNFSIRYSMSPRDVASSSGEKERSHTVLLRLELRTLGEASVSQNFNSADSADSGLFN